MRNRFDSQLEELNVEMIKMGGLCEEAISLAINAILKNDESLLDGVFKADRSIDRQERDIEALCMRLLMQQQPVASDLRFISSALKMVSDMERIGDQASDIAEIAMYIIGRKTPTEEHVGEMAEEAVHMVTDSIDSYVRKDLELARRVIDYDDVVDNWFAKIKRELIENLSDRKTDGEYYVDLLMIAKYLERIGDHATNIAEWVEYSITGEHRKK